MKEKSVSQVIGKIATVREKGNRVVILPDSGNWHRRLYGVTLLRVREEGYTGNPYLISRKNLVIDGVDS